MMMQLGLNGEVEIAALTPTVFVEDLDHCHHEHLLGQYGWCQSCLRLSL